MLWLWIAVFAVGDLWLFRVVCRKYRRMFREWSQQQGDHETRRSM